jgi:hypothetical protein
MNDTVLSLIDNLYYKFRFHFSEPKYLYLGEQTWSDFIDELNLYYLWNQIISKDAEIIFKGMKVIKVYEKYFIEFGSDYG